MRLKSGMNVRVVSGNHKGKEGKILKVIKDKNRIIIEGVNLIKKHTSQVLSPAQWPKIDGATEIVLGARLLSLQSLLGEKCEWAGVRG
jgi:ribosomal protein L24